MKPGMEKLQFDGRHKLLNKNLKDLRKVIIVRFRLLRRMGLGFFDFVLALFLSFPKCLGLELEERTRREALHPLQDLYVLRLYAARILCDRRGMQIQTKN